VEVDLLTCGIGLHISVWNLSRPIYNTYHQNLCTAYDLVHDLITITVFLVSVNSYLVLNQKTHQCYSQATYAEDCTPWQFRLCHFLTLSHYYTYWLL